MLPSGLPELVADDEDLARFLTSSNHFNTQITSVPTLVEQSQLVGVGGGDFLMRIIMKQAIDGGFFE